MGEGRKEPADSGVALSASAPFPRRPTRRVRLGALAIGGGAPVSVQTMATADTRDANAAAAQARACFDLGADVVRFAVPDAEAAAALASIKRLLGPDRPIVADIHFDHRLAIAAIEAGVDGLRLNPGNVGSAAHVREVAAAARGRGVPIRVGVNAGSLEKSLLARFGGATPEALVESALGEIRLLEDAGCEAIKASVKASDLPRTVAAYRLLSTRTSWPLHVGLTEAGTLRRGTVAGAAAIGILLAEGIGDTIRFSITAPPEEEVRAGVSLLQAMGLRPSSGTCVTSCPTCGRTQCDLVGVAQRVEEALEALYRAEPALPRPKVAVMGCVVNGPGEARDADLALVGGRDEFLLFRNGAPVGRFPQGEAVARLLDAIRTFSPRLPNR